MLQKTETIKNRIRGGLREKTGKKNIRSNIRSKKMSLGERGIGSKKTGSGDFLLVILTMILVIFGVIMVFSASYYSSMSINGSPYTYFIKDIVWVAIGSVALFGLAMFDYHQYRKLALWILLITFIMLILLMIPGVGIERNHAVRWLGFSSFTIMPGEIAKIALIIFIAVYLSADPKRINSFKSVAFLLLLCGVFAVLIIKQPNLSTAITVVMIVVIMMVIAGMHYGWLAFLGSIGLAGFSVIMLSGSSYWKDRILSFTDPFADPLGEGFQVVQSLLALGSGGLFGTGLGKSVQKNLYLPEPQNDFILAVIGEELGYIGIIVLLAVYLLLIWRGVHIAINAPDQMGTLLASGITAMIAIQVILNVAIVTSSMPPTGVILPFISYGGNAQILFMGSIGILLNISRYSTEKKIRL